MAQDKSAAENGERYRVLGDEVALVLSTARQAADDLRDQAKHYADALIAGTRQEIEQEKSKLQQDVETQLEQARFEAEEIRVEARSEAIEAQNQAKDEAKALLDEARRKALTIMETAQKRVDEAERAYEDAVRRREAMEQAEKDIETGVSQVLAALHGELDQMKVRRESTRPLVS